MKVVHIAANLVSFIALIALSAPRDASGAEEQAPDNTTYTRQATFKLTFRNKDLDWIGDPASPNALAYPKKDALPIATDFCVTTVEESHRPTTRRFFREARISPENDSRKVYAFTEKRELVIGTINNAGRFEPTEAYSKKHELLPSWPLDPSVLAYDADENALYSEDDVPGPLYTETLDFLPLQLTDSKGAPISGSFTISYKVAREGDKTPAVVSLVLNAGTKPSTVASAEVPNVLRRSDMQLGSFDNALGTYLPESAYRSTANGDDKSEPSVTVLVVGRFDERVTPDQEALVVDIASQRLAQSQAKSAAIAIDGKFDDWRNVPGVDDPHGDLVPYLEYVPDVDLLEFKVAHDSVHIYQYARVAGRVGYTYPKGGRSYFYAYLDVDQDPGTGFLPSRDDECYYGVEIGDDCEVQFEFVDNVFRKSFYGFCGLGGDDEVLKQTVTIGKSQYGRLDENGRERKHYKSEYIFRNGVTEITEDLKLGTSDTIKVAVSPDGSEVEVVSALAGFLKDRDGRPTVALGQMIDVAAGMECDSKAYPGKSRWAADSTKPIRGYRLTPLTEKEDVDKQAAD
jgi:hypothetical protein